MYEHMSRAMGQLDGAQHLHATLLTVTGTHHHCLVFVGVA